MIDFDTACKIFGVLFTIAWGIICFAWGLS